MILSKLNWRITNPAGNQKTGVRNNWVRSVCQNLATPPSMLTSDSSSHPRPPEKKKSIIQVLIIKTVVCISSFHHSYLLQINNIMIHPSYILPSKFNFRLIFFIILIILLLFSLLLLIILIIIFDTLCNRSIA